MRLAELRSRLVRIYQREIWQTSLLQDTSLKGVAYAILRVISITVTVFMESRIPSRAAALSFSSLLGFGPLLAISVLVAGFAIGKNDPSAIATTISRMIKVVAPQIAQYEEADLERARLRYLTQTEPEEQANPQLVDVINNIITASRSGSAGALGASTLIIIVLLLFKAIEDAFNDIWGVRQGRSVLMRIVLYWTVLTLGAVLFFTSVALLGAGTFVNMFMDKLPGGPDLLKSLAFALPLVSFSVLTVMLTLFYRVIPNTRVFWSAAFVGAIIVAALLVLNNYFTFLYVKRIYLERSLYGGLALPLVMMSSLYIFWLCVLTGGIVSFAIQNVHFRNSQLAWSALSGAMRERLALVVFLTICRRFRECLPPVSASQLSEILKVPTQLLNECLNRLVQLELITVVRPDPNAEAGEYLYQPARPLNRLTLFDFKTLDDNLGENPITTSLEHIDPLVGQYIRALAQLGEQEFFRQTIDQLFDAHPFGESRPPFAQGERTTKPARP